MLRTASRIVIFSTEHYFLRELMLFFLTKTDDECSSIKSSNSTTFIIMLKINIYFDRIGIYVQGTSAKFVRVKAYWRIRNGKKEFVRSYYRKK